MRTGYDDCAFGYGNVMGCGEPDDDVYCPRCEEWHLPDDAECVERREGERRKRKPWWAGDKHSVDRRVRDRRQSKGEGS